MTHAGATQTTLDMSLYCKEHTPEFLYTIELIVNGQAQAQRFTNNNTMPDSYRETDKAHVEKLNNRASGLGLITLFPNLPIMFAVHDASETLGEPKTINGILFKGLDKSDLPEFERLAFQAVAIDAAISVVKHPQQGHIAKQKFLGRIDKDKLRMDKHSVFYKGHETPECATPMAEILDIYTNATQRLKILSPNGEQQTANDIITEAIAYYDAYSSPIQRQTNPMVATAKLLDSWEGIHQLTAVATKMHYNMHQSKDFALLRFNKQKTYEKNGGIPMSFVPSADILSDTKRFAEKIIYFRESMQQNMPDHAVLTSHVINCAKTMGVEFLMAAKPFYSFSLTEPQLNHNPSKHTRFYSKIISHKYKDGQVFTNQQIVDAFLNGVDVTNHKSVKKFTHQNLHYT